jgi:hypothetical protein
LRIEFLKVGFPVKSNLHEYLFKVVDLFSFGGRVVILTDRPIRSVSTVRVGDAIEFRNPDGTAFQSKVAGVEFAVPSDPNRPFAFPIPSGSAKEKIRIGAEIWSISNAEKPPN